MDDLEIIAGDSKYVYKVIDNRKCIVLKTDPNNLDFTFLEKHDKETKTNFFVNLSHSTMVWELPDVTKLPPMESLPKSIIVQCTEFQQVNTNIGRPTFAPSNMPAKVSLAPAHYWVADPDEAIGKYVFINADPKIKGVRTELPPTSDLCQRIQRLFSHYNIGTPDECIRFISDNAGQEEKALMAIIDQHGEEPEEYLKNKNQLLAILNKYSPGKISDIIMLLDKHKGKEDALITKMSKKYGNKPLSYLERAECILKEHAPEKLDKLPDFISVFIGREEGFIWALSKCYNTEEPSDKRTSSPPNPIRDIILHYALKYAPAKDKVNVTFESFLSNWNKKNDPTGTLLLASIKETYVDEPSNAELDAFYDGFIGDQYSKTYRERLINMYRKYQPEKLDSVDKKLARYSGKEEKMIVDLVETLGPEPTDEEMEAICQNLGTPRKTKRKSIISEGQLTPRISKPVDDNGIPIVGGDNHAEQTVATEEYMDCPYNPLTTTNPSPPTISLTPEHMASELDVLTPAQAVPSNPEVRQSLTSYPYGQFPEILQMEKAGDQSGLLDVANIERTENQNLSSDEIRNRVINLLTVYEPQMLDVLPEVFRNIENGEDALYKELLERYKADPTEEQLNEAKSKIMADAHRNLVESQERDDYKKTQEHQELRMAELIRELEQAKAFERERRAEVERQQKELLVNGVKEEEALADLAVVETRRKRAESAIDDLLRRSKFAASLQNDEAQEISDEALIGTVATVPPAGANALVLIESLTTLEDKLQRAYSFMETSIQKGDSLRAENEKFSSEINELKSYLADSENRMRIAMIEAENDALRRRNDHEREKLSIQGEEQELRTKAMDKHHRDQQVISAERIRLAQESRELRNEVEKQREIVREQERIIRRLEIKYEAKEKEELEARVEMRILKEKILLMPSRIDRGCQTDSTEYLSNQRDMSTSIQQVIVDLIGRNPSWRPQYTFQNSSIADQVRAVFTEMELDYVHWRQSALSLRDECEEAKQARKKLEEEYDEAIRVISILRIKNQNLESKNNDLQYKLINYPSRNNTSKELAIRDTAYGTKSPRDYNTDTSTYGLVNGSEDLSLRLTFAEAESKALKKEISDLRGLLTIHMSSPKGQR